MAEEAPTTTTGETHPHEPKSTSELMGSAKTVAEAAQFACTQRTDKIEKAKVAGAAEDVLEATKSYGKLDDKSGAGQYVDKAEGYLHNYHAPDAAEGGAAAEGGEKVEEKVEKEKETSSAGAEKDSSTGGVGGLMNKAKGLFTK